MSPEDRIDILCDVFEAQWLNGEAPKIEAFIDQAVSDERAALFYQLLLVELEYRHKEGEQPSRDEYLQRFPQFSDQIEGAQFRFGEAAFVTSGAANDDSVRVRGRQPGSRVGHFELRELVGAGAMGEVWRAWDPQLQRPVAVKLPRVEGLSEADMHRFMREGRAAAQLRHPQLAQIYAVGREGPTAYIVSDYVEGENLRQFIDNSQANSKSAAVDSVVRRSTYAALADLCAEIAEALHHAHEQGIVHRDLKPANIIMDRAGRPHVIDFGLAKWSTDAGELTLQGDLLGTPAYMSPEQAGGNAGKLDRRTDVYSLGVILYELLTGQCPFAGETGSVLHRIIAVDVPPVRKLNVKVPRDLETICIKALEKNPDRRYATMQEMAVDLRRFARGEPILSRRPGPVERSWRWVRRHPGVAAAILAIVLLASTSGAVIRSLTQKNYRLQGYRPVRIETGPPGARVAFVRINDVTGEPYPNGNGVIRPDERTPFNLLLRPGNYLVEAVLPGANQEVQLDEIYLTIPPAGQIDKDRREQNREQHDDEDLYRMTLNIGARTRTAGKMLAVPISEGLRRENPLLPKLLYVDAMETKPKVDSKSKKQFLTFAGALNKAQKSGKRLASAAEYEAIKRAALDNEIFDPVTGEPAQIIDLFGGVAEWTTTKYQPIGHVDSKVITIWQDHRVLAGYGDPDALPGLKRTVDNKLVVSSKAFSAYVGFRGVRSGTPRFIKP